LSMGRIYVFLALLFLTTVSGYNYCNNKTHICNLARLKHFMCGLGELTPLNGTVKFEDTIPDCPKLQATILGVLNEYRSVVAGGELIANNNKTIRSASRMRLLIWDDELGYLARSHAKTVSMMHTKCRSTLRFPLAGEVLALIPATRKPLNLMDILTLTLGPVFEEYRQVQDPDALLVAFDPDRDHAVAHFTVFISDRVSRVGCGIATGSNCSHGEQTGICHFLTCMFDYNNIAGDYVYKTGLPATDCMAWGTHRSGKYSSLCDNNGDIMFVS
ncbi:hypothetical protein KR009_002340, partial [Drosophila setifemur]